MVNTSRILIVLIAIFGILGIVYSWPIFLGVVATTFATIAAWVFMPQILIILPALLPFHPALNPTADVDLAAGRLVIIFLAIIGSIYIVYTRKSWFNLSTPTILIMLFLFWSLFSGIAADDLGRFVRKYLVFLTIFPIYFLVLAFLHRFKDWEKLFHYWSWSAFVISLIGLGQFLFQFVGGQQTFFKFWGNYVAPILYGTNAGEAVASNPSWFVGISGVTVLRSIGTFPDPHMLAFFLGMSIPLQVAYVLGYSLLSSPGQFRFIGAPNHGSVSLESKHMDSRRSSPRVISRGGNDNKKPRNIKRIMYNALWILPVLSFSVLLLTFSRGSYVGLAGVVIWLAAYFWRNYPAKRRQRHIPYGTRQRLAVGVLIILIFSALLPPVRDRFTSILDVYEGSNKGRLEIWGEALDITLNNPVFGVGLGNYASIVRPEAKYREPIYAHNTYLDLSSEIGIPGAAAWILTLIWAIKPLFLTETQDFASLQGNKIKYNNYNLAVSLGILWFSLHAFFETPIFSPQILPLILVLIAFRAYAQEYISNT